MYEKDIVPQSLINYLNDNIDKVLMINQKKTQEMINETRLHLPARLSRLKSNYILHCISDYVNTNIMENKEKYSITKEVEVSSSEKVSDTDIMIDNAVKYGKQSASAVTRDLAKQVKEDKEVKKGKEFIQYSNKNS